MDDNKKILALANMIHATEKSLSSAKKMLHELMIEKGIKKAKSPEYDTSGLHAYDSGEDKIVEGVYTGTGMLGTDKNIYPIPDNYASKSHLVQGSKLKATIHPNGRITYKIIEEIPYVTETGVVIKEKDKFKVHTKKRTYDVLLAALTFLKAEVGDKVSIRLPEGREATFACVESIIPATDLQIEES